MTEWYDDPRVRQFWQVKHGGEHYEYQTEAEARHAAQSAATPLASATVYECRLVAVAKATATVVDVSTECKSDGSPPVPCSGE